MIDFYAGLDSVVYLDTVPNCCWSYYTLQRRKIPLPEGNYTFMSLREQLEDEY